MGSIFKTGDTKICLYTNRKDPVKKVKLMIQEKGIMAGMKKERANGWPLIGARTFIQSNRRESRMSMSTIIGSW